MQKHTTLAPLIALFAEDGYKAAIHEPTDRRVQMRHRMGRSFTLDLDLYGVTLIMGGARNGHGGIYGYGVDLDAAKRAFRANGGSLSRGYSVIEFAPDTLFLGVNGMGSYSWLGDPPAVGRVAPTKRSA